MIAPLNNEVIVSAHQIFRPFMVYSTCIGLFVPKPPSKLRCESKTFKFIGLLLWTLCIQSFLWSEFLKALVTHHSTKSTILDVTIFLLKSASSVYLSTALAISISKNILDFLNNLDEYQHAYGQLKSIPGVKKISKWGLSSSVLLSITTATTGLFLDPTTLKFINIKQASFQVINVFIVTLHGVGIIVIFTVVCKIVNREFAEITQNLKVLMEKCNSKVEEDTSQNIELAVEKCRLRYGDVLLFIKLSNTFFNHIFLSLFALAVPFLCFVLYIGLTGTSSGEQLHFMISMIIIAFINVGYHLILCSRLSLKAQSPGEVLINFNQRKVTAKTSQSISMFLLRLSGEPIGFKLFQFFTINTTTILNLIGLVMTYAIVIVQFSQEGCSNNAPYFNNTTFNSSFESNYTSTLDPNYNSTII